VHRRLAGLPKPHGEGGAPPPRDVHNRALQRANAQGPPGTLGASVAFVELRQSPCRAPAGRGVPAARFGIPRVKKDSRIATGVDYPVSPSPDFAAQALVSDSARRLQPYGAVKRRVTACTRQLVRTGAAVCLCLGVCACGPRDDAAGDPAAVSEPSRGAEPTCDAGGACGSRGAESGGLASSDGAAAAGDSAGACRPVNAPPIPLPTIDSPCYGGATVRSMLSLLNSQYGSTFAPQGPPPGVAWSGSTAPSALTMVFGAVPSAMQCLSAVPSNCGTSGDCGPCAVGPVELEMLLPLRFFTADGTFDETLTAAVSYVPYPGVPLIRWSASESARALQGSYPPMFGQDETLSFQGKLEPLDQGFVSEAASPAWVGGGEWGD
jgi:hypothetical protein